MNMRTSAIVLGLLLSGCTTLGDVKDEMDKAGFALWYPAEAGIEAGQIWQIEGQKRIREQRKPNALEATTGKAQFETLKKSIDASTSLDLNFTNKILGNAGDMAALLKAGTVKSVELNFGDTVIQRITMGDLREQSVVSRLPSGYASDLRKVQADNADFVLIGAVVTAAGMKYIFKCEDSAQLQAKAPEIAKSVSADFNLKVVSKTEAVWEIPNTTPLVIGILPVYGKDLDLGIQQLRQQLSVKLRQTDQLLKAVAHVTVEPASVSKPTVVEHAAAKPVSGGKTDVVEPTLRSIRFKDLR